VNGDLGNVRLGYAAVKAAVEIAWPDERSVPGGEDKAGFGSVVPGTFTVVGLVLFAELQGGAAQVWQWQGSFGCVGLDLTAKELAADAL
jgi:hypothetical protein